MKKKIIIITTGAGLLGFAGMFAFAWFTKPKLPAQGPESAQANSVDVGDVAGADSAASVVARIAAMGGETKQTMSDQQLQALIYEVREKIKEYNLKLRELNIREQRLQAAQDSLKSDIEEMATLRVELASTVATLKNEQDRLAKSKIEIEKSESENLVSIAATYDKMDAESAAKILMNMVKSQSVGVGSEDAVKILYYMTERTKAKVLASIAEAEPAVSAYFCQKLKKIITTD